MIILGNIQLPDFAQKGFREEIIEHSATITSANGSTGKDVYAIKRRYIIKFEYLNKTQVNQIIQEYEDLEAKAFVVDTPNLTINTTVLIDIPNIDRFWQFSHGSFILILTEV